MIAISESEHCEACSIEARIGTEEVPHPIDPRLHTCCVAQPQPRSVVRWFAAAMERELHENDHKGTWDRCTLGYLAKRLREEVEELVVAATDGHVNANIGDEGYRVTQWTETDVSRVLSEAADVGNFAMMIADVCAKRATLNVAAQTDGRSTTTIKVDNQTIEPIVVLATMAGVATVTDPVIPWSACGPCRDEPDALSPCPCHHAPCIHDRNKTIAELHKKIEELREEIGKQVTRDHSMTSNMPSVRVRVWERDEVEALILYAVNSYISEREVVEIGPSAWMLKAKTEKPDEETLDLKVLDGVMNLMRMVLDHSEEIGRPTPLPPPPGAS
jgi:hypothetical protein